MNFGRTPYGERRIIDILGGTVSGPKLKGRILPGGADWQIIRADGAADIQARYTIETETGAASWCRATACGMVRRRCWKPGARRQGRSGSLLFPHRDAVRDPDPAVDWLNRILALASGKREARSVRLDVYEVL